MSYIHITVKAVIIYDNKILLLKRTRPSSDGLGVYELPGGGLVEGESFDEAIHREVFEETGLAVDILEPAYTFRHIRSGYCGLGLGFLCQAQCETVAISFEHEDYLFASLAQAEKLLNKEIFSDVKNAYDKYIRNYE